MLNQTVGFTRSAVVIGVVSLCTILGGCSQAYASFTQATWQVAPGQNISGETTELTIEVSRVDCSNGVTGTVLEPIIRIEPDQIVIMARVEQLPPGAYNCLGNDAVPQKIVLPEPIGTRNLVDGECTEGGSGNTSMCENPVRWRSS